MDADAAHRTPPPGPIDFGATFLAALIDARSEGWRQHAACLGMAPRNGSRPAGHPHFPFRGQSVLPAKAVCSTCPVRAECLDYALTAKERFGVWGGMTPLQRRYVRHLIALGFTQSTAVEEAERLRYRRSLVPLVPEPIVATA